MQYRQISFWYLSEPAVLGRLWKDTSLIQSKQPAFLLLFIHHSICDFHPPYSQFARLVIFRGPYLSHSEENRQKKYPTRTHHLSRSDTSALAAALYKAYLLAGFAASSTIKPASGNHSFVPTQQTELPILGTLPFNEASRYCHFLSNQVSQPIQPDLRLESLSKTPNPAYKHKYKHSDNLARLLPNSGFPRID